MAGLHDTKSRISGVRYSSQLYAAYSFWIRFTDAGVSFRTPRYGHPTSV